MIDVRMSLDHPELLMGFVRAEGVFVGPADPTLHAHIERAVERARAEPVSSELVRAAIRDLLRHGGFKPTGRSKPASEYLVKAAREIFPSINNLVDINNLTSLQTGWPCSILDLDRACPEEEPLEVRLGRKNETYVFNTAGQSIDVSGLLCVARADGDVLANPVKDSMATKTHEGTTQALFVVYTSLRVASEPSLGSVLKQVETLLQEHAGASSTESLWLASR